MQKLITKREDTKYICNETTVYAAKFFSCTFTWRILLEVYFSVFVFMIKRTLGSSRCKSKLSLMRIKRIFTTLISPRIRRENIFLFKPVHIISCPISTLQAWRMCKDFILESYSILRAMIGHRIAEKYFAAKKERFSTYLLNCSQSACLCVYASGFAANLLPNPPGGNKTIRRVLIMYSDTALRSSEKSFPREDKDPREVY